MKKQISLLEFIKTGSFGGAILGMTDKEVVDFLGEPDWKDETPDVIWFTFDNWEIHFLKSNNNAAFLIHNDHLLYDCVNHDEMIGFENDKVKLNLDFIKPFNHIRLKQILGILEENKMKYNLVNEDYKPLLQLENNIYMDFIDSEPSLERADGFYWGAGNKRNLNEEENKIKNQEDFILYTIGASSKDYF